MTRMPSPARLDAAAATTKLCLGLLLSVALAGCQGNAPAPLPPPTTAPTAVSTAVSSPGPTIAPDTAAHNVRRLHGHNDYLQPVPLQRALELGLGSVECDVFLVDGELRIGHERWQLRPGRTLTRLYLEPLRQHAERHGGRVRADGEPFVLLVDIKAEPGPVYDRLRSELLALRPLLTRWENGRCEPGAITVILSGARPLAQVAAERDRVVALDGRLADLARTPPPPPELMPWISDAWSRVSDWNGRDEFTPAERQALTALVQRVHAAGHELRFWGAPDEPAAWQLLLEVGVDRIGTDRPARAAQWLAPTPEPGGR